VLLQALVVQARIVAAVHEDQPELDAPRRGSFDFVAKAQRGRGRAVDGLAGHVHGVRVVHVDGVAAPGLRLDDRVAEFGRAVDPFVVERAGAAEDEDVLLLRDGLAVEALHDQGRLGHRSGERDEPEGPPRDLGAHDRL